MEVPGYLYAHVQENIMIEKDGIERRRAWAVVLGLVPEKDGNQWLLLWGKNIQEGVCGFGDTPEAAVWDFEKAMNTPLTATSQPVSKKGDYSHHPAFDEYGEHR